MSLIIPTTAELNTTLTADLESAFGITIPVWAKAFLRVMPKSLAGALAILYKYGGSIFLQQFVQYASTETILINGKRIIPLVEWGRAVGAGDPGAATRAEYEITITVSNQVGTLPALTPYRNPLTGVVYLTLSAVTLDAATKTVNIRAYSDPDGGKGKGTVGNMVVGGDTVSLVTPNPNVVRTAAVTTENTAGVNAEDWEEYRDRVIDRFRSQPQGGAPVDFRNWAVEVTGIINAYPYTGFPGIVNVYSEANTDIDPDGIPTAGQLVEVYDSIQLDDGGLASRRPISSYVYSLPITRSEFDVTIAGIQGAQDTADLQAKLTTGLTNYFLSREPYIYGLSVGARLDRITRAQVGGIIQSVCGAYGAVYDYVIVDKVAGPGDFVVYVLEEGEKAKMGTLTFALSP